VNIDKERANAAQLAARLKITFPVVLDPDGKIADQYDLPTMPTSFLIDRTGVVRFVHAGFRPEDVAKLRRELDELSAAK
jgi:peroxiredoxin